jgi:hypothetical protein
LKPATTKGSHCFKRYRCCHHSGIECRYNRRIKNLPGAQQIGNQEGLFVRGGTGEETKQFIDGTLLNNPYYTSVPILPHAAASLLFFLKERCFPPEDILLYTDRLYLQR